MSTAPVRAPAQASATQFSAATEDRLQNLHKLLSIHGTTSRPKEVRCSNREVKYRSSLPGRSYTPPSTFTTSTRTSSWTTMWVYRACVYRDPVIGCSAQEVEALIFDMYRHAIDEAAAHGAPKWYIVKAHKAVRAWRATLGVRAPVCDGALQVNTPHGKAVVDAAVKELLSLQVRGPACC